MFRSRSVWSTSRRNAAVCAVALLAVGVTAGCGGDDDAASTSTTAKRASTTTSTSTTTTTAAPATTSTTTASSKSTTTAAGSATTGGVATTAPVDPVPDGTSFGYLTGVSVGASTITIDIAELLTGDAAVTAALEDGVLEPGETSIDNDYYIRNKSSKLRTAPVASTATVMVLANPGSPDASAGTMSTLADDLAARVGEESGMPVQIVASGGVVSRIDEMFFP